MAGKSVKIGAGLVIILFIGLVVAAANLLLTDSPPNPPIKASQPEPAKADKPVPLPTAQTTEDQAAAPQSTQKQKKQTPVTEPKEEGRPMADVPPPGRRLSPAQMAENRREIKRMKEKLPDNMWIPENPQFGKGNERGKRLGKAIQLGDKIKKGTATPEEKIEYYEFKINSARDRIELMQYIADRTRELEEKNQKQYLSASDIETGNEKIADLEKKISTYQEKLAEARQQAR